MHITLRQHSDLLVHAQMGMGESDAVEMCITEIHFYFIYNIFHAKSFLTVSESIILGIKI